MIEAAVEPRDYGFQAQRPDHSPTFRIHEVSQTSTSLYNQTERNSFFWLKMQNPFFLEERFGTKLKRKNGPLDDAVCYILLKERWKVSLPLREKPRIEISRSLLVNSCRYIPIIQSLSASTYKYSTNFRGSDWSMTGVRYRVQYTKLKITADGRFALSNQSIVKQLKGNAKN